MSGRYSYCHFSIVQMLAGALAHILILFTDLTSILHDSGCVKNFLGKSYEKNPENQKDFQDFLSVLFQDFLIITHLVSI